jgi:hypothetical protein
MHSERPDHRMYEQLPHWCIVAFCLHLDFPVAVGAGIMIAWVCGMYVYGNLRKNTFVRSRLSVILLAEVFKKNNIPEGFADDRLARDVANGWLMT